ncbi:hypothetical protein L7F22_019338 [Adiantum nelumboides]|nr:hypothetical protein [Adiantum nelumboides]
MASTSSIQIGNDHTQLFQSLIEKQGEEAVESRRKWEKRRDESLGPILSASFIQKFKLLEKQSSDKKTISQRERDCLRLRKADEEWFNEAVKIQRAIVSINDFQRAIRKPYLATTTSSARPQSRASANDSSKNSLDSWRGVQNLNDKERDEIEFQVKITIKRCLARIKELEEGENVRKRTTVGLSHNPFSRLLGSATTSASPGRSHPLYAEQLSQHRFAITQYLNNKLAQTNAKMGDLQEARLKAQRVKQINLAGSAATLTSSNGIEKKREPVAGSVRATQTKEKSSVPNEVLSLDQPYQSDFSSSQLTAEQIQQFDKESSALVESLSDDLRAVEAAERKLSEISELQTQLIQHLGNQTEMADNLHQEALGHTLEVGKGNEQLQRAKENNRQANRFLCIFLIGSGLGLLFLHCEYKS